MSKYEEVKVTNESGPIDETRATHPAFGMIGFSRVRGGDDVLFGSSIGHNEKIALTLKRAESARGLSNDHYYGKDTIVEIEMSYSQFAECISAMNVGDGIPCTLRYTEKDGYIPMISENKSKRQEFENEFTATINKALGGLQGQINAIQESLDSKKPLGVNERKEIVNKLTQVRYNIGCNLNFVAKQFNKQMDKTVCEAKGEVEAFCQNKILSIGSGEIVKNRESLRLASPIDLSSLASIPNEDIEVQEEQEDGLDLE